MRKEGEEEWRRIDSLETASHFHIHRMLKFGLGLPQKRSDGKLIKSLIGWHGCDFFLYVYNYEWFSIIVDVKRSAKICFVVPICVYASNWAHEVMIMQDVYLCIVEVQQWSVCKVIDTSMVMCNYTIIITHRIQRRTPCFKHDHYTTIHSILLTIKFESTFWHASFLVTCAKNESRLKSSLKNCKIGPFTRF